MSIQSGPHRLPASQAPRENSNEVVVLVHGTFAGDKDRADQGSRWWQRGSATWTWLEKTLPSGVSLPDGERRIFHWSGSNSQADRLAASTSLLAYLIGLEMEGRNYHLVGHSHGGSVMWEALVSAQALRDGNQFHGALESELIKMGKIRAIRVPDASGLHDWRRKMVKQIRQEGERNIQFAQLSGLRSWTTVGTPYLTHFPRRARFLNGWPRMDFSLAEEGRIMGNLRFIVAYLIAVAFPAASMLYLLYILLLRPLPLAHHLPFANAAPIFAPMLMFVGIMAWVVTGRAVFGEALLARNRHAREAFERFSDRWLGLWSETDEAITLLRGVAASRNLDYLSLFQSPSVHKGAVTEHPERQFPPVPVRLSPPPQYIDFAPQERVRRWAFISALFYVGFNRWLAQPVGAAISRTLVRAVHGNDLPRTTFVTSSQWPIPLPDVPPGLPTATTADLEKRVLAASQQLVPTARILLTQLALGSGANPAQTLVGDHGAPSGEALVHTSYFDNEDVLRIIRLHICRNMQRAPIGDGVRDQKDALLAEWLTQNNLAVKVKLQQFLVALTREN